MKTQEMDAKLTSLKEKPSICLQGNLVYFDKPLIMGVINVNQDSFFSNSRASSCSQVLEKASLMVEDGAAILDIGATSSRPGAALSTADDEISALKNILPSLRKAFPGIPLSVDTYHASVARMAASEGIDLINDISAGTIDPFFFETLAELRLPYVLMHMQGIPPTMQTTPTYTEVTAEVIAYLAERLQTLNQLGIQDVILDPGFGFGKTLDQNYALMHGLPELASMKRPILVGVSRKSMVTRLLNIRPEEALNATTALHMLALQNGANMLRVHDVKAASEAIAVFCQFQFTSK